MVSNAFLAVTLTLHTLLHRCRLLHCKVLRTLRKTGPVPIDIKFWVFIQEYVVGLLEIVLVVAWSACYTVFFAVLALFCVAGQALICFFISVISVRAVMNALCIVLEEGWVLTVLYAFQEVLGTVVFYLSVNFISMKQLIPNTLSAFDIRPQSLLTYRTITDIDLAFLALIIVICIESLFTGFQWKFLNTLPELQHFTFVARSTLETILRTAFAWGWARYAFYLWFCSVKYVCCDLFSESLRTSLDAVLVCVESESFLANCALAC